MVAPLLLIASLAASSPALTAAQKHLDEGNLDELAFDLGNDAKLTADEAPAAAEILTKGAAAASKKGDSVLAYQLAQTAHRRDPQQTEALRVLVELSLADHAYLEAEGYLDALGKLAPADASVAQLRARVTAAEKGGPQSPNGQSDEEARLHAAAEIAAQDRAAAFAKPERREEPIVVYGTTWCGYCKKARAYFDAHHLAFEDKDIEKDSDAAAEMKSKLAHAHLRGSGVPVLDVRGTIIQGFNPALVERALARSDQ